MEVFDIFLLEAVLNGILLGGLLALLSLGLNLIFGVIDVMWICYAEMIMIGMYAVYTLHVQYHWPLLAAMAAGIACVALLGALMHRFEEKNVEHFHQIPRYAFLNSSDASNSAEVPLDLMSPVSSR